ncbi:MAG: Sodium/proton antiporter [Candidatus Nomurabacteria bacterium]|nr:Sodium/proton antiporter [Candidatus Nomurabacteria bacterium]
METQETPQKDSSNAQPTNVIAAIATSVAMIAIAIVIILHSTGKTGESPATTPSDQQPRITPSTIAADIATVRTGDANYTRGDINTAQVVVIEYSDSDCPFCVKFHPTLQQIVADYKGKVAWVYRFFPLEQLHPNAFNEALALECAGQLGGAKAFNSYLDSVINLTLNPDPKSNELLTTLATQQGVNASKFKACITAPATEATVRASIAEAEKIGAQGTPYSVIVNKNTGKQVAIPGAYPIADVKKAIDSLLK